MNARDKSEDGVFENQHQDGGGGSESGDDADGVAPEDEGNDDDAADAVGEQFQELRDSDQSVFLCGFLFGGVVCQIRQEGRDDVCGAERDEDFGGLFDEDIPCGLRQRVAVGQEVKENHCAQQVPSGVEHGRVEQIVIPDHVGFLRPARAERGEEGSKQITEQSGQCRCQSAEQKERQLVVDCVGESQKTDEIGGQGFKFVHGAERRICRVLFLSWA